MHTTMPRRHWRVPLLGFALLAISIGATGCSIRTAEDEDDDRSQSSPADASMGNDPDADQADAGTSSDDSDNDDGDGAKDVEPGEAPCEDEFSCSIPPLDRGIATNLRDATRFLYSGDDPVQVGLDEKTLEDARISVLRGNVFDREGQALGGVRIEVHRHDELGRTATREDGQFDLVVNGGQTLTVGYSKSGYLPAQRTLRVDRQEYEWLPNVVLIQADAEATEIEAGSENVQVIQGSVVEDDSGERQATMLMLPNTEATAQLEDGSSVELETLTVRATEYTVGDNGPEAMPSTLPATSAYTYAVDLTIDEANELGAESVTFSQPIPYHIDNFLGFPAGTPVPLGYYDRRAARWVPSDSGLVIDLVELDGEPIGVDSDGDGEADPMPLLEELGVTDDEVMLLADLYEPGQSLWRVMIPHFSIWDHNWPFSPPDDSIFPDFGFGDLFGPDDPCPVSGSILFTETQVLGESIPLFGTEYQLNYFSNRGTSRLSDFTIEVPLTPDSVPESLKAVELEVLVAGQRHQLSFDPEPSQLHVFEWDGLDGYGRLIQGETEATVRIGYVYDGSYTSTTRFASPGDTVITGSRTREEVTLWNEEKVEIGAWDASGIGLGGFGLDVHHSYNPLSKRLRLGDGTQRSAEAVGQVAVDIADPEFDMGTPDSVTVAPDGRIYYTDDASSLHQVLVINLDGSVDVVAGIGEATSEGDGGPATEASLDTPQGVYLRADGTLLVAAGDRIRSIDPEGTITTLAGGGAPDDNLGDGLPAHEARLNTPDQLIVGPDDSLYIAELDADRVRRVDADGIITTFAGGGTETEGGLATEARLDGPSGLALSSDGSLYISERDGSRILRVSPDGQLSIVIEADAGLNDPRSIAFAPDGALLISDELNDRVARWDGERLTTVVGGGSQNVAGGVAARNARIPGPDGIALGSDGSLYIASDRILRVSPALPDLSVEDIVLPSRDGAEMFVFDGAGRHIQTRDALTTAVLLEFDYDEQGRLASVRSRGELTTSFKRNADGELRTASAPFGQNTSFETDDAGRITRATDPLDRDLEFAYGESGLLEEFVDAAGGTHEYAYDDLGRVTSDTGPTGYEQTLSRDVVDGGYEVSLTTSMGRVTSYGTLGGEDGASARQGTNPAGFTATFTDAATARTSARTDGSQLTVSLVPDVRWQMQVPFVQTATLTTPAGRELVIEAEQTVEGAGITSPLTPGTINETFTTGATAFTRSYDAESESLSVDLGEGRVQVFSFDERGQVARFEQAGLPSVDFDYDDAGRVVAVREIASDEERVTAYGYDDNGFLAEVTDALGNQVSIDRDVIGRVRAIVGAGGEITDLGYNDLDLMSSLVPPERDAHAHDYDAAGLLTRYVPPAVADGDTATDYSYNADLQLASTQLPDERQIERSYDDAGRISGVSIAAGDYALGYDDGTGQLTSVAAPSGDQVTWTYDGPLVLGASWSGSVEGDVSFDYDEAFRVASVDVAGGDTTTFAYDDAGALIEAGPVVIDRAEGSGLPVGSELGDVTTEFSYDPFAELTEQITSFDGEPLLTRSYDRDALGRITRVSESIDGEERVTDYEYDASGRLIRAATSLDGEAAAERRYEYDANGNRTLFEDDGDESSGDYDEQDRLTSFGALEFEQTPAGDVQRVTNTDTDEVTEYEYDELGQLTAVTLPDGSHLEYAYDLVGRRIAKRIDGDLSEAFIYEDRLRPAAKLDADGAVVQQYIYATGINVPDALLQGGTTYALIRDQVGSVRLVVDTATGEIAQRLDYDEFGRITNDTNPGFQPFGFAGGLYDANTGLVRFGYRDYDARIGRWTSKDPIRWQGGQTNLYVYVGNDGVNFVDPTGEVVPLAVVAFLATPQGRAIVGAVVGGTAGAVSSALTGGSGRDIAGAAAGGAVAGAIGAAIPGGFLTEFIANTGASAIGLGVEHAINGKEVDPFIFGGKAVLGGLAGASASKLADKILPGGEFATLLESAVIGSVFGNFVGSLLEHARGEQCP